MNKEKLPLTFQFSKKNKIEDSKIRNPISIGHTKAIIKKTENFYKPISKIIVIKNNES